MINQTSSSPILFALSARAVQLDVKLNKAHIIKEIYDTEISREVYRELYQQNLDAWTTYWRVEKKFS